jgi:hypothetical protein
MEIKYKGRTYFVAISTKEGYCAFWRGYYAYGVSKIIAVDNCHEMINGRAGAHL